MRRLLVALSFLTLAACNGDSATNPSASNISGRYQLRSVNGRSLPYSFGNSTLQSDNLTIAEGGSWSESLVFSTASGTQTTGYTGSWSYFGNSVTLTRAQGGTAYTGTYAGNGTLNVTDGADSYSFSR